jgi:hypothetical protein
MPAHTPGFSSVDVPVIADISADLPANMPQSFRAGSGLGDKMMLGAVGKRLFRAAAAICKR